MLTAKSKEKECQNMKEDCHTLLILEVSNTSVSICLLSFPCHYGFVETIFKMTFNTLGAKYAVHNTTLKILKCWGLV